MIFGKMKGNITINALMIIFILLFPISKPAEREAPHVLWKVNKCRDVYNAGDISNHCSTEFLHILARLFQGGLPLHLFYDHSHLIAID
jgi:hypothetical protein